MNSQARAVPNATFELQKAPGQDLAQKGRFGSFPKETLNSQARAVQNANFELQQAPSQELAQKGRFGSFPQEKINSRPRAVQDGKFPDAFQRFPEASQKLLETCAEIFQRLPEASERPPGASQKLSRSFPIYPVSRLNALPPRDRRAASPSTQTLDWNRPPKPMLAMLLLLAMKKQLPE